MGYSSQAGQVGFGIQAGKGVAVPATRFAKLRSGGLGGDRSLLVPDPEIGGHRDVPQAYLGPVSFGGDLEFYPRMQMLAVLMQGALGSVSSTNAPGPPVVGTHVFTPADSSPWLTVEEAIGNGFESLQYTDCKVNSLRVEAEATGYLMGSCNVIGLGGASGFTRQASPAWDETPMMVGGQVQIEFNGSAFSAKSFNFEVNNNIESDDFELGSMFLADAVEKRREVKMGLSYRPQDAALWRAALWGGSALTGPQAGPAYQGSATITISSFETIGNQVAGTTFKLIIEIPSVVIAPHKVTPSGDDVIGSDLDLTLIRPDAGVPIFTATIVNDLANVS